MPELPEVETIVRGLREILCQKTIEEVIVYEDMVIGYPEDVDEFREKLTGREITGMGRRGKYIVLRLSGNKLLIVHLRMTGKLLVRENEESLNEHTRVKLKFKEGFSLYFDNVRKFGRMYLVDSDKVDNAGGFEELGPEPLGEDFSASRLKEIIVGRTAAIKAVLLDQKNIAGLGNIYTDEALFRAGIDPGRAAGDLEGQEVEELYNSIISVLRSGIKYQGTSFSDYVNALGESGSFQDELMVYSREGENCPHCSCQIEKKKTAGRSTHYCPKCQE